MRARRAESRSSTCSVRGSTPSRTPTRPSCRASSSTTSTSPTSSSTSTTGCSPAASTPRSRSSTSPPSARSPGGQPFRVESVRPIQMSTRDALDTFVAGRAQFTLEQWRDLLLRSVGFEPDAVHASAAGHPARAHGPVRRDELQRRRARARVAPASRTCSSRSRRTPTSSRAARRRSPTCSSTTQTGRRGLVAQYDVDLLRRGLRRLLRHEGGRQHPQGLHGVRRVQPRQGEHPRRRRHRHGRQLRRRRRTTSFAAAISSGRCRRRCATTPRSTTASTPISRAGTSRSSIRRTSPSHFGFVSDFLAECWSQLRRTSRLDVTQGRLEWGSQLSGRDRKAANNTVNGLLKLLWPNPEMEVPDDALAWAAELALEMRRRVKEQQAFIGAAEFGRRRPELPDRRSAREGRLLRRDRRSTARETERVEPHGWQRSGDSEVLPEPDPAEVQSSVGAKAADYAVGDVIDGRFEILEVLGRAASRRSTGCATSVEGEERALKLFDNAAGYDAVRREIGALRKVHHPQRREGLLGRQDERRRLVSDHGVHRRRVARRVRDRQAAPARSRGDRRRARRPRRTGRHPSRRRAARASSIGRSATARLSEAEYRRVDGASGEGPGASRHQAAQRHAHPHRREAARLQHRLAGRRPGATRSPARRPTRRPMPTSPGGTSRPTCSRSA